MKPARLVFWPFPLFGNPGAEQGVFELHDALIDMFEGYDQGSRQQAFLPSTEVDLFTFAKPEDLVGWRKALRESFDGARGDGEVPILVGGNHLVALPVLEAYGAEPQRTCFVSFDAHLDAYDLAASREPVNHGNFLLHARRGKNVSVVNVGSRDLSLPEAQARKHFDRLWTAPDLARRPITDTARELAEYAKGFERVHLDIDLDVLDPSALRTVGSPMPFGLTSMQLLALVDVLIDDRLEAVTISEYNGSLDHDGMGKHVVLWLLEYILLRRARG
jgi:agmatinase